MRGGSNGPKPRGCGFAHQELGCALVAGPAHVIPAGSKVLPRRPALARAPRRRRRVARGPGSSWSPKPMRKSPAAATAGMVEMERFREKARLHGRSMSKEGIAEPPPEYRRAWAAVRLNTNYTDQPHGCPRRPLRGGSGA